MKLPRTIIGWKRLFWIFLRRCMYCHTPLCRDWPLYDDGTLWCLSCGGVPHPDGVIAALRGNRAAVAEKAASR